MTASGSMTAMMTVSQTMVASYSRTNAMSQWSKPLHYGNK